VNELNDSDTNTAKLLTFLVRYITSVTTNAKTFYVYFIHGTFYVFNVFYFSTFFIFKNVGKWHFCSFVDNAQFAGLNNVQFATIRLTIWL